MIKEENMNKFCVILSRYGVGGKYNGEKTNQ